MGPGSSCGSAGGVETANTIIVDLPRTTYFTGDVVTGAVILETTREVSTRGLTLDILGRESTEITQGSGENQTTYRSRSDHVAWRLPLAVEGSIPAGSYRFPFQFQVPNDALPSYAGTHAKVEYSIAARLDVPWWPDAVHMVPFYVVFARESIRTFSRPVRFRSGGGGPEIYVELDGDRFFARELLGCRITILRTGERRIRRLYAQIVGGEWARADKVEESKTRVVSDIDIPIGMIGIGRPFTFELPISAELPSSYRGRFSYYSYVLRLGLDIAWASDIVAETPIVIVR